MDFSIRNTPYYLALLGAGALFGFFFTMSVSIMPGFDITDPYAALITNQNIGRATQKSLFFVALLGTPLVLVFSTVISWKAVVSRNWLLLAFFTYIAMMGVTVLLNVPLNQRLDGLVITSTMDNAADHWQAYSVPWQQWNWLRVLFSGASLLFVSFALRNVSR